MSENLIYVQTSEDSDPRLVTELEYKNIINSHNNNVKKLKNKEQRKENLRTCCMCLADTFLFVVTLPFNFCC